MQDRQPTPGKEGRVLITPEDGSTPFYATIEMADDPLAVGTKFAKQTMLQDATAFLAGLTSEAVPDDVFKILLSSSWRLIELLDNSKGMSGVFTAPDVFHDGAAYDLGVYLIGGGGAGSSTTSTSAPSRRPCTGGGSGYGVNIVITDVTPGQTFNWEIGPGGKISRESGGTTTFDIYSALGGNAGNESEDGALGGQPSDFFPGSVTSDAVNYESRLLSAPCGCAPSITKDTEPSKFSLGQSPRKGQNMFDLTMLTLAAGGGSACVFSYDSNTPKAQTGAEVSFGKAGDGLILMEGNTDVTKAHATGYGNGGGAVSTNSQFELPDPGKGSDGAIFIYARR